MSHRSNEQRSGASENSKVDTAIITTALELREYRDNGDSRDRSASASSGSPMASDKQSELEAQARAIVAPVFETNANIMPSIDPVEPTIRILKDGGLVKSDGSINGLEDLESGRKGSMTVSIRAPSEKHSIVVEIDPEREPANKNVDDGGKGMPPEGPINPMHPSQFPEGGRAAWTTLVGAWCCLFVSFGWINCIGVFQDYYQNHQLRNYPASTVAWIPSCETFMMFIMGPFVGKLVDNYGPRPVLFGGTILHVFGLMMTSISTEFYQILLSQGICSPMGASAIFFSAMQAVTSWFFRRRAFAFGLMAAGSSIGGVIFPILVANLVPKIGFAWTMRICAFLILGLLTIANLTLRSRIKPRPRPFDVMEFVHPLKELTFDLTALGGFFFFIGNFLPYTYVILQAASLGVSPHLQAYLIPIMNGASFFGRVFPGYVADKVGRFNVMVVMCFITALTNLVIWLPAKNTSGIIAFAVIFGFGSGTFVSMSPALVAQITNDLTKIGVRNGTSTALYSVGALFGPPLGGAILAACGGRYYGLQTFTGVVQLIGVAGFVAARVSLVGWKPWVKV